MNNSASSIRTLSLLAGGFTLLGTGCASLSPAPRDNHPPVIKSLVADPSPACIGRPVTFTTRVFDLDGDRLICSFDFGDGSPVQFLQGCRGPLEHTYERRDDVIVVLTAADFNGGSTRRSLPLRVVPCIGPAPVARNDTAETLEDQAVTINVLRNDFDLFGGPIDPSTVEITHGSAHGNATANADGTVTYEPEPNFDDTDEFRYRVSDTDGNVSNEATVTVDIEPVNDAPQIESIFWTQPPGTFNVYHFGWSIRDVDGDTLACTFNPGDDTAPYTIEDCANDGALHIYNAGGRYTITLAVDDGHDGGQDQASRTVYVAEEGVLTWTYQTGGIVNSGPAIRGQYRGTFYVGSADGRVYAITPSDDWGMLEWSFPTEDPVYSSPSVGSDGTIYVGSDDHNLYALDPDAVNPNDREKWRYPTAGKVRSSPAIGSDGTIYVGSDALYAINSGGERQWDFEPRKRWFSPVIGKDGTIYAVCDDVVRGFLYAVNPDGSAKWNEPVRIAESSAPFSPQKISPSIGADNTIYVGSWDGFLYAIDSEGNMKWRYPQFVGHGQWSSPAIGSDGTIYAGAGGRLYAIDPETGNKKWETSVFVWPSLCGPVIGSNDTIYVGSTEGHLYAINPEDGGVNWRYGAGGDYGYHCPAINGDGTIHVGSSDYYIYSIRTYSYPPGLGPTPWPKFQHDRWNRGRSD